MATKTKTRSLKSRATTSQQAPLENVIPRIRSQYKSLGRSARSIADFVLNQPDRVVRMSVTELAEATGASQGSVINFCRHLGMSGFQQLKLSLAQEVVKPVQYIHEDLQKSDNASAVCRKMFHSGIQALRDTLSVLKPTEIAKAAGAKTIVITNFARAPIHAHADVTLFTMARETKFRTEAMTSRIAQLCVIDTLIAALALADYDRATETLRRTFEVLSIKRF